MNVSQAFKHSQFLNARFEVYMELVKMLEDAIRTRSTVRASVFVDGLRAAFPLEAVKHPVRRFGLTTTLAALDAYFEPHGELWAPHECRKAYDVYTEKCEELMELLGIENY